MMQNPTLPAAELGSQTLGSSFDMVRYLGVCAVVVVAILALGWFLRRFLSGAMRARAAKRSLQVLDVLPLGRRQRLMVVRCYDRSFLVGAGEKELTRIAELDPHEGELVPLAAQPGVETATAEPARTGTTTVQQAAPVPAPAPATPNAVPADFRGALREEGVELPQPDEPPQKPVLDGGRGILG